MFVKCYLTWCLHLQARNACLCKAVVTNLFKPKSPDLPWWSGQIYLLRHWEKKTVQTGLPPWGFLFGLIVIEWNQTLWSSFQMNVTKNTLNDLISVQLKKEYMNKKKTICNEQAGWTTNINCCLFINWSYNTVMTTFSVSATNVSSVELCVPSQCHQKSCDSSQCDGWDWTLSVPCRRAHHHRQAVCERPVRTQAPILNSTYAVFGGNLAFVKVFSYGIRSELQSATGDWVSG